jgi:hypothetical protein
MTPVCTCFRVRYAESSAANRSDCNEPVPPPAKVVIIQTGGAGRSWRMVSRFGTLKTSRYRLEIIRRLSFLRAPFTGISSAFSAPFSLSRDWLRLHMSDSVGIDSAPLWRDCRICHMRRAAIESGRGVLVNGATASWAAPPCSCSWTSVCTSPRPPTPIWSSCVACGPSGPTDASGKPGLAHGRACTDSHTLGQGSDRRAGDA